MRKLDTRLISSISKVEVLAKKINENLYITSDGSYLTGEYVHKHYSMVEKTRNLKPSNFVTFTNANGFKIRMRRSEYEKMMNAEPKQ